MVGMTKPLDDPWDRPKRKSSRGIPPLNDPSEREDLDRPLRTEDLIPRHAGNGQPKLWLPDGSKMAYYGRPSGWGKPADNTDRLGMWETRMTLSAFLDYGSQSRTFRAERMALGPPQENKDGHNALNERALNFVADQDRVGTALHKITERHDLNLPLILDEEFQEDLVEWVRLTRYMEIVELPTGAPGIECFVAMDVERRWPNGEVVTDASGDPLMVRLAGTFDRLFRYTPCEICGRANYIADLKSGKETGLEWSERVNGIQLGSYRNSKLYVPHSDGCGADRYDLPDVCPHRGIIISLPAGSGSGSMHWIDIARGYERAICLIPQIKAHQSEHNWMREFVPVPNIWAEIDKCASSLAVRDLWNQYPGQHWADNGGALTIYASNKVKELDENGAMV